ncbi:uncharacterized protein FYW61_020336 isoform 1-T3 [Anableps anableps]
MGSLFKQVDEDLSVALLNINGLRTSIPDIRLIIKRHQLHVVALCETKLDASVEDNEVFIAGFRMWRRDRTKYGGGIALYVQDHIEAKLRCDLIKTEAEIIWVEMKLPDSRPVLLGCCYRRPNNDEDYLREIFKMMTQVSKERGEKDILLMGDFNIDWNSNISMKKTTAALISRRGLTQIVRDATRVTQGSETCIDHIYTNIKGLCSTPTSTITGCSDHNLVTVTVRRKVPKRSRRSNRFDKNKFKDDMQEAPWTGVSEEPDPKNALDKFTELFLSVADDHAPLESYDIYDSQGLDDEMKTLISERDKAKKDMIEMNYTFKKKKKEVEDLIRKNQKTYYHRRFDKTKTDPKKLLNVFEKYLGEHLPYQVINITLDGAVASEAEHQENLHGTSSGPTDGESILEGSQVQQIMEMRPDEFSFGDIRAETVKAWLVYLCGHATCRMDKTEAKLLELAADHISHPVCLILNGCFNSEEFPGELRKIQTLPSSGNYYGDFRQSSSADRVHILLSYVFDLILYLKANQFFTLERRMTSVTRDEKVENIATAWLTSSEASRAVGAVFLDFSSLFNTISHDLLMDKLRTSGFSASALSLTESFLSVHEGSRGLPPGSFLAELLFIVFINDLIGDSRKTAVLSGESYMVMIYADGDPRTLKTELDDEMEAVRRRAKQFNVSLDKTGPEVVKPRKMPEILRILKSLLCCHGDEFDWIRALREIVQHYGVWDNPEIITKLEPYFGKRRLASVPGDVMESVINSLRLSRPDLRGF